MKLERLVLYGFGRFQGLTLNLAPGFNVIYGPNEAGKSTIQAFLLGMLYGFKKRTQRRDYTPDLARYHPWAGGEYRGALEYELEQTGQQIRVERHFEPAQEQVLIYDRLTGADLTEQFPMDRRKERLFAQVHLGLTEELFRSTAWVGQLQVSRLDAGQELVARIANLQQSGQEDLSVAAALAWLDERAKAIGTERAAAKPLGRAVRRLGEVRAALERAEQIREQTLEWEAQLAETQGVLAEMTGELAELERRLAWARYREAAERLEQVRALQERLQAEAESLEASLADLEAEMEPLRPAAERGEEALRTLDRLEREMAAIWAAAAADGTGLAGDRWAADRTGPTGAGWTADRTGPAGDRWTEDHTEPGGDRWAASGPGWAGAGTWGAERSADDVGSAPAGDLPPRRQWEGVAGSGQAGVPTSIRLLQIVAVLLVAGAVAAWVWLRFLSAAIALTAAGVLLFTGTVGAARRIVREAQLAAERARLAAEEAARQAAERKQRLSALEAERARILADIGASSPEEIRTMALRCEQLAVRRDGIIARLDQIRAVLAAQFEAAASGGSGFPEGGPPVRSEAAGERLVFPQVSPDVHAEAAATGGLGFRENALVSQMKAAKSSLRLLERDLAALQARLEGEDPHDSRSASELQAAIHRLERRQAELTARASDLAARVETVLAGAPDIADLRRELAQLEEERAAYEEELAAIHLAREGIEAAAAQVHREFAPQLNAALSRAAEKLTCGRYRQVRLDEEMNLRVLTGDGRTVEAAALSGGTVDQLYFSLRLALLDLLTQGQEPVPLLLDDPFIQYDDQRAREAMALVGTVAEERQVVLFTCHQREMEAARKLGAHVIRLDVA